jgi:branched-chain amino acid aminotransferase
VLISTYPFVSIGYQGKDIPIPTGADGLGGIARAMLERIQGIQTGKIESDWSVIAGEAEN